MAFSLILSFLVKGSSYESVKYLKRFLKWYKKTVNDLFMKKILPSDTGKLYTLNTVGQKLLLRFWVLYHILLYEQAVSCKEY